MPPKRKSRLPTRAVSTPSVDASEQPASEPATPQKLETAHAGLLSDVWTDEQEASLLKSVIRWKPVGSSFSTYPYLNKRNAWPLELAHVQM